MLKQKAVMAIYQEVLKAEAFNSVRGYKNELEEIEFTTRINTSKQLLELILQK